MKSNHDAYLCKDIPNELALLRRFIGKPWRGMDRAEIELALFEVDNQYGIGVRHDNGIVSAFQLTRRTDGKVFNVRSLAEGG